MAYNANNAVIFATGKSGRYGDGECWTLVEDAVVGAGGKSSRVLTPNFSATSSYVWGTVVQPSGLQPGDVLQFSNYSWTRTVEVDVTNPDGSGSGYNDMDVFVQNIPPPGSLGLLALSGVVATRRKRK